LAALFTLPGPRDALLRHFPTLDIAQWSDPFAVVTTVAAGHIQAGTAETSKEREQRLVTEFIAKRYRVAEQAVTGFVATAYRAGAQYSVDPLLILAVMAVESRYNPVAESVMGARGLMQVIPKFHLEKLLDHGGEDALLDPDVNIQVGAQILREYTRRFGDTETALQMYAGAFDEPTSQYANKVLAEKARLEVLRQRAKKPQTV
jgi:soluble lytic murein transglycosylase-like protein